MPGMATVATCPGVMPSPAAPEVIGARDLPALAIEAATEPSHLAGGGQLWNQFSVGWQDKLLAGSCQAKACSGTGPSELSRPVATAHKDRSFLESANCGE